MAEPSAVEKPTVTVLELGLVRVTGKEAVVVPELPSVTLASPIEIDVVSSFRIVPVPLPVAMVAPDAPERLTENVSSGSTVVSPLTVTSISGRCSPG